MASTIGSILIILLIMATLVYALISFVKGIFKPGGNISDTATMICPNCGTRGTPKNVTRGSIGIELILWPTKQGARPHGNNF